MIEPQAARTVATNPQSLTVNGGKTVVANFLKADTSFIQTELPINVSRDLTDSTHSPSFHKHWEPSTGVGPTWVHSYSYVDSASYFKTYIATWSMLPGQVANTWNKFQITDPNAAGVGDLFLAYDSHHNGGQYLLVGTGLEPKASSLYLKKSHDGIDWREDWQPILAGSTGLAWDFGSVAVDSRGRIAVGAVNYPAAHNTACANGFWVRISETDGTFSSPAQQVAAPTQTCDSTDPTNSSKEARWGIGSRLVAAGDHFYVFTPALLEGAQFQPTDLSYYEENSSGVWSGNSSGLNGSTALPLPTPFNAPLNNAQPSNGKAPIYYAPLLDASGNNESGTWAVTFQGRPDGVPYNNAFVCTNRSYPRHLDPVNCFAVNQALDDQFLNGVSVDSSGGIWVSYLTYSGVGYTAGTVGPLPLYHQTIYLKPDGNTLGVTGDYNVDPTLWRRDTSADRCQDLNSPLPCLMMGDYARIGANNYFGLDSPYVNSSKCLDEVRKIACVGEDIFQIFAFDPKGSPPSNTFVPNLTYYPKVNGPRGKGKPNPPGTTGVAPEKRRKMPGKNGH